jgi:hypothetical protein
LPTNGVNDHIADIQANVFCVVSQTIGEHILSTSKQSQSSFFNHIKETTFGIQSVTLRYPKDIPNPQFKQTFIANAGAPVLTTQQDANVT